LPRQRKPFKGLQTIQEQEHCKDSRHKHKQKRHQRWSRTMLCASFAGSQPLACVWGCGLLAQAAMVISRSHQAAWLLSKSAEPVRTVRQGVLQSKNSTRRARRQTSLAERLAPQAIRALPASFPRPLDVIAMSASGQSLSMHEHRSTSVSLFARAAARVRPLADCITAATMADYVVRVLRRSCPRNNGRPCLVAG
jgi:hypothetical protein